MPEVSEVSIHYICTYSGVIVSMYVYFERTHALYVNTIFNKP